MEPEGTVSSEFITLQEIESSKSDDDDLLSFDFIAIDGLSEKINPFEKVAWMTFRFKKDFNYVEWICEK